MKTMIAAALVLMSSVAAATAGTGPANSTNQHLRDSADFYDSVPDFSVLSGERTGSVNREASNRNDPSRVIAR
ncbi:hypothetical protein [Chenggangzhangella methanolivorans]|uniref:Uncharacterized protein n=1 Tax=Chenggangzhangella methanolivorans TaxID=1437009 RepID=A0A9E6R976_9HYPH|nr:hypothetical protein [Chenggangzhangella methanolivorans]QZO00521.1 hypothetical protein K6K41_01950 [Chenggangzhangella methanolivorans]